jgi:hypothetical protein
VSYRINAMLKDTYRPEAGKISVHDLLTQRLLQNAVAFPAATGEAVTSQRPFWELNEIAATRHTGIHIRLPNAIFEAILVLIRPLRYTAALSSFFRGQRLVFLVMLFSAILICATPWPEEIHDGPIIIAALKVPNTEVSSFGSPQSATK